MRSAVLLLLAGSVQGTTYYVSPAGSDGNPGTGDAPFQTIQQAAKVVNPGDTVIVRDGTYSNAAAFGDGSSLVVVDRGGTSDRWVTFIAENSGGAVIDGLNNTTAEAWTFSANYVRVQGFEVKGFRDDAFSNNRGGQYIDIYGNDIHDIGRYCTATSIGRDGIYLSHDNVLVEHNRIHDIGRYAPGEKGCTSGQYYQTNDHAIYISGANNITVRDNFLYRNQRGWSIHVYPAPVSGLSIVNNVFSSPNPWQPGYIILAAPVINSQIVTNIFDQPNAVGIHFYNAMGYSNLTVNGNTTYGGRTADGSPSGVTFLDNRIARSRLQVEQQR